MQTAEHRCDDNRLAQVVMPNARRRSVELLTRTCNQGWIRNASMSAEWCLALGQMYLRGEGVSPDKKRAEGLFRRTCTAGSLEGCAALNLSAE
jgi:TPR repeat protein